MKCLTLCFIVCQRMQCILLLSLQNLKNLTSIGQGGGKGDFFGASKINHVAPGWLVGQALIKFQFFIRTLAST